jgi:putative hemolysin
VSQATSVESVARSAERPRSANDLEVRLAADEEEIDAAKALRYRVFYEEMAARPTPEMAARKRDFDRYDDVADHLLAIDRRASGAERRVVGTYRLIRRSAAAKVGGFYSAAEYDLAPIVKLPGEVLELGRSCVDKRHRTRGTMQLLWGGIADYVWKHQIGLMFGCGSLPGTDPDALAVPLTYLHAHHLAPPELRARALESRYVEMRRRDPATIDSRRALAGLPPLIKGYLRLGGFIGDGAVIDEQFNTTDVLIMVKTSRVTEKYREHYAIDRDNKGGGPD